MPPESDLGTGGRRISPGEADLDVRCPRPLSEAAHRVGRDVAEIRHYMTAYVMARLDGLRASVRSTALMAIAGLVAGTAGMAMVVTASVLLLVGLAGAMAALYGDRSWAGQLTLGVIVLAAVGVGLWLFLRSARRKSMDSTRSKYEREEARERARFGRSATD